MAISETVRGLANGTVSRALIGIAGVHFVAAELSRRGLIALPTIRNTAACDIIVVTPDGKRRANIQVKTSQKRVGFWPMPPSDDIRDNSNDYYVLLRWLPKEDKFEGFMLKGREAKRAVNAHDRRIGNRARSFRGKPVWGFLHVDGKFANQAKNWKKRWNTWNLF